MSYLERLELDPAQIAVAAHMLQAKLQGIVIADNVVDLLTWATALESLATEYRVMAAGLPNAAATNESTGD